MPEKCLGIYVLEDEELTVCVAPAGRPRPTSFDSRPGSGHRLYLLRRFRTAGARLLEPVLQ